MLEEQRHSGTRGFPADSLGASQYLAAVTCDIGKGRRKQGRACVAFEFGEKENRSTIKYMANAEKASSLSFASISFSCFLTQLIFSLQRIF